MPTPSKVLKRATKVSTADGGSQKSKRKRGGDGSGGGIGEVQNDVAKTKTGTTKNGLGANKSAAKRTPPPNRGKATKPIVKISVKRPNDIKSDDWSGGNDENDGRTNNATNNANAIVAVGTTTKKSRGKRSKGRKKAAMMMDFIEEEQRNNNAAAGIVPSKPLTSAMKDGYPAEIIMKKGGPKRVYRAAAGGSGSGKKKRNAANDGKVLALEKDTKEIGASICGSTSGGDDDMTPPSSDANSAKATIRISETRRKSPLIQDNSMQTENESSEINASVSSDAKRTETFTDDTYEPVANKRNANSDKVVMDVSDASSTTSAKQRRTKFLKPGSTSMANENEGRDTDNASAKKHERHDENPPHTDWIDQMIAAAKQMERMATATKQQFEQQKEYYESKLLQQEQQKLLVEKEGGKGKNQKLIEQNNHRLENELRAERELNAEKGAQLSDMKEENEALRTELSKERESSKEKDASIEKLKKSLRLLL